MILENLRSLRRFLQVKRNFIIYIMIGFGIPFAAGIVWVFGGYGGIPFAIFLIVVSFVGAYCAGQLMWHLMKDRFGER